MKYTILPPQKAAKRPTAHRSIANLGEHRQAFMNLHNQHGWVSEPEPEQPESDAMMAMAATLLLNNRRNAHKPKHGRLIKANQLHQVLAARGKSSDIDADIFSKPVKLIVIPGSPLDEYHKAIYQARSEGRLYNLAEDQPLLDVEYQSRKAMLLGDPNIDQYLKSVAEIVERHNTFRKHILGTHTQFSYRAAVEGLIPPLNNNLHKG